MVTIYIYIYLYIFIYLFIFKCQMVVLEAMITAQVFDINEYKYYYFKKTHSRFYFISTSFHENKAV